LKYDLHQDDAVSFLGNLHDGCVDLCITDLPYESLEKHRAKGTTTRLKHSKGSSNDWFDIFPNARFEELFGEVHRVLKPNTHFYFFCDEDTKDVAKPIGKAAGFTFWKAIIWDKVNIGMGYHYRSRYEYILFFEKGRRKLNDLGKSDILTHKRVYKGYPCEKPLGLAAELITQSSEPEELVLDPFMGSGATGVDALRNGRYFMGNDLSASSLAYATPRLEAE